MTLQRIIIIPARYQSSRLPAKLLQDLAGKPVIVHTIEKGLAAGFDQVMVAIDDERIEQAIAHLPITIVRTRVDHQSGTERLAEVIEQLNIPDHTIIVNLQADEPFMQPELLKQVADNLQVAAEAPMATLCESIQNNENIFNPNIVKVIMNQQGMAQYFSRAPIPWFREGFNDSIKQFPIEFNYFRHVGLYAYRAWFVKQYIKLSPSPWEEIEKLEQLRVLWHGYKIHIAEAIAHTGVGIDTLADLEQARKLLNT